MNEGRWKETTSRIFEYYEELLYLVKKNNIRVDV
jgi:hypothetical protein